VAASLVLTFWGLAALSSAMVPPAMSWVDAQA